MRFRTQQKPPPYLNRRDQIRLLAMVGLLALVVVAMRVAARPSTWHWLTGDPAETNARVHDAAKKQAGGTLEGSGRSLRKEDSAGTFAPPASVLETLLRLDPALLDVVEDHSLGVRRSEADAYFQILARLREIDPRRLADVAMAHVPYAALSMDAAAYRGRPLLVQGRLKRLQPLDAVENAYGIERLYSGWLVNRESGDRLYHVVATSLPEGIPTGTDLDEAVRVSGLFFKMEGYAARSGLQTAPLLLVAGLEWFPRTVEEASAGHEDLLPWVIGFVSFVAVALGATVWWFSLGDRRFRTEKLGRYAAGAEPTDALPDFADIAPVADPLPHADTEDQAERSENRAEDNSESTG